MRVQAIAMFILTVLCCSLSHAQFNWDSLGDITSEATPQHLQINDKIRSFLKNRAVLLNNEMKTAKIKDTNAINTILGCVIQGFEIVTLKTDFFNFVETKRRVPEELLVMMFQPVSQTLIRKRYLTTRKITESFLKKSHSNGKVTQYINVKDNDLAITYIGETSEQDKVWIKTFIRKQSNSKIDKGFRAAFYINTNLLCIRL